MIVNSQHFDCQKYQHLCNARCLRLQVATDGAVRVKGGARLKIWRSAGNVHSMFKGMVRQCQGPAHMFRLKKREFGDSTVEQQPRHASGK